MNDSKNEDLENDQVDKMQSKDIRYESYLLRSAARRQAAQLEMIALREMIENYPLQWIYPSPLWNPLWKP